MWRFILIAIVFFNVKAPVLAQRINRSADEGKPLATIPFQIIEKHIVIPVLLSGSADTLHFIFDTGAEVTVINMATAAKVKLKSIGDVFMSGTNNAMVKTGSVSINALYIREVRMPYVKAYLEDLSNLGAIDGIIGVALLKPYIVKIDFNRQELVLYKLGKHPLATPAGYCISSLILLPRLSMPPFNCPMGGGFRAIIILPPEAITASYLTGRM